METQYQHFDNNVTPSTEDISANKMICALSAIALEMQKFHAGTSISCHNFANGELGEKLSLCKSSLRLKRKQIKSLKENLRKACFVARTVMSAKESANVSLHNNINNARSECADLFQKNKANIETIENLEIESKKIRDKLENLQNFIELGYQELQKIRNLPLEKVATIAQLKEIILSCGQYYADYCNEAETRRQMEQKNRFLNNKINILGTNLKAIIEDLKNVRQLNIRLQKENCILKNKNMKEIESRVSELCEDRHAHENKTVRCNLNKTFSIKSNDSDATEFTSHLTLVKNLLSDQDRMLKDLRNLSDELNLNNGSSKSDNITI